VWRWSKLSSSRWADAWEERFYGNPGAVIHELKGGKTVRVEVYCPTESDARLIQEQFGGSARKLTHEELLPPPQAPPPPLKIRDCLVISQETSRQGVDRLAAEYPGRHLICVPAEMAFGTGDHPTTATCLRFLVDVSHSMEKGKWSALDLGCGSGVLAIAARMLGAARCQAVDYDPNAVAVAKHNCERNGVEGIRVVEADVCQWSPGRQFELITANLFAGVLARALPMMAQSCAPGGRLILSGILREQWETALGDAQASGFILQEMRLRGKKWCSALFAIGI
jgi:ribosomal protein L11 methyltransferase